MAQVDGIKVKVGDFVGFKCDIEQYGSITKINGNMLTIKSSSTFDGEYIGGQEFTQERASDCWID